MILAHSLQELNESELDFTDCVIEEVRWENSLLDLTLTLEYIWDTQPKRLHVSFQNCWQADFQRNVSLLAHISEPVDPANSWSWYTIVSFRGRYEGSFHLGSRELPVARVQIYTTDFETPWLTLSCQEVLVEELHIM